jgi:hypothetical protein
MANSLVVRKGTDLAKRIRALRAAQYVRMSTDFQRYSKASGSGRQARLTRHFFGECNASEEDATDAKAQNEQDQSDVDPCLTNDIDGHAKPDQHGRGRCNFGRSSAHPPGRQAFLRGRGFAHDRLWNNAAHLSENVDLRVPNRASRTQ